MRLNRIAISFALALMVAEFTYINAKSLVYLVDASKMVDQVFSIVGSLAFSVVTVIVMRNKGSRRWMKVAFPIFDTLLVFCGFNLKYADEIINGTDNPIRFWLTVFMAVFAGIITYSLGIINYKEVEARTKKRDQYRINELINKLQQKESELRKYKSSFLKTERSRILKKKQDNRTEEEISILNQSI